MDRRDFIKSAGVAASKLETVLVAVMRRTAARRQEP